MICPICGSKNPDGSTFCIQCGAVTDDDDDSFFTEDKALLDEKFFGRHEADSYQSESYSTVQAVPVTEDISAAANKGNRIHSRFIAKIAFLLAIVCFFFPFMSVSCDTSTVTGSGDKYNTEVIYSGYNIICPTTISDKNVKKNENVEELRKNFKLPSYKDYGNKEDANPWLLVTLLCCILGMMLLFIKKIKILPLASTICAVIALASLIIFNTDFYKRYITNSKTDLSEIKEYLKVNVKFGFVICFITIIIAFFSSVKTFTAERSLNQQR